MQIGTATYGPSMDPGYAPYEDLPKRLRKAMLRLRHYENLVSAQVSRVVDAAAAEWLAVEKRAEDSAAVIAREEGRARDRATCVAAIDKRKVASTPNERPADWASIVADGSEHAADLLPVSERPADWKTIPRCPPSTLTGYTGVILRDKKYRAKCGGSYYGVYQTAEEAAEVYDRAAIEANIDAGYTKHRLNFSRARPKRPRAPEAISTPDLHCSEELDGERNEPERGRRSRRLR